MKSIAVISPVLNEELVVDAFIERLRMSTRDLPYEFAFIIVDDGSTDATLEKLLAWQEREPRLKIVKLSRNWGHQNAFNAGIDQAGEMDAVVLMDSDLQDPPDLIAALIDQWEAGFEVVSGVRDSRRENMVRRLMTSAYYHLIGALAQVDVTKQSGIYSLIDGRVIRELRRFGERNKSYANLRSYVGFRQTTVHYNRDRRFAGKPKQTALRLVNDALNALFAFSYLPVRVVTLGGLALTTLFLVMFAGVFVIKVLDLNFWILRAVPGWTTAILLILAVASFQFVFLGILGEYIARILDEVRQRPYYIVDRVFDSKEKGSEEPVSLLDTPGDAIDRFAVRRH